MSDIKIFTDKSVGIDLMTLIDSRMLCCANSGAGKSYLVRKLLEQTHGKVLSIILDMEGEFHTLREKFDYLLVGGKDGDVQINLESAKLLPKTLLELNVPTIIDMSDLKRHDRVLYVKNFLEALMGLSKEFWKPCLIVVDEAHQFAGQQELQDSCGAVIDLMTRGRKRGFCGVLCSQRISKLHKDAVAECNNYFVGRTSLDIDMKRSADILGFASKNDLLSLRDLDAGEFYIFGTAVSKIIRKAMVDKVVTTHPKVGSLASVQISPPTPKIKAILEKISALPKKASDDLKELSDYKKRIRELELELKGRNLARVQVDVAEHRNQIGIALRKEYESKLSRIQKDLRGEYDSKLVDASRKINKLLASMSKVRTFVDEVDDGLKIEPAVVQAMTPKVDFNKFVSPKIVFSKSIERHPDVLRDDSIVRPKGAVVDAEVMVFDRCARKIYSFLYHNASKAFTKVQVGAMIGYSPKSGGFNNSFARLNSAKALLQSSDGWTINEDNLLDIVIEDKAVYKCIILI